MTSHSKQTNRYNRNVDGGKQGCVFFFSTPNPVNPFSRCETQGDM